MQANQYQPSLDTEGRLLLLINAFSRGSAVLEGRTKLAKLDFFLRYPAYLSRGLAIRRPALAGGLVVEPKADIETRMVRYRYGPWDPAYYAVLGRLIGKGLVEPVPFNRGIGYKVTDHGRRTAERLSAEPAFEDIGERLQILKRHFNLAGSTLKNFIYEHFPEVTQASWGETL